MNDNIKKIYMLLSIASSFAGDYMNDFENIDFAMDSEVNKCQLDLYLLMLCGSEHPEFDVKLEEFYKEYKNLPKEKQDYIRQDYYRIINNQEKNKEKGEKKL